MFLALRAEVEEALSTAFASLDWPVDDLGLEEPPSGVDAVLASSAAFRLAEVVGASPPAVARRIADAVEVEELTYVEAVRAEGPYVNVDPSAAYFSETLATAQDTEYGRLPDRGESVIVEHTSANPTGPIHVGRARNPIVGDAIARVLDLAGYDVERHYYVNDAGRQIAVFTWAVERFDESDLPEPERDRADYDLVRYYRRGNDFLEGADPDAVEEAEAAIGDIMQGLEAGDEATFERVSAVVDRVLDGMRESLSRLPAEFDRFVKETRFIRDGSTADVVRRLKAMHEADLDDGAWKLDLSADGIEKKLVFVRSDGTSLYPTRDLAHHEWKLDRADQAVTVLGEDHKLQADQLTATLDRLGHDVSRLRQVFHSWVTLPEGGMSTRAGTGIDLDDLLDEAIERARAEVESRLETRTRDDDLGAADIDRIARQVGVGAVRYDIVAKQPTKGIAFDWEEALDFEAQSAPYVQYVHARCCGILDEAAGRPDVEVPAADAVVGGDVDPGVLERPEERDLLRVIARFPAVVEAAASNLEPHAVASYTRTLAEAFNAFYRECPVLDAEDEATREARLALTVAARHSVANALGALGVAAPESM